MIVRKSSQKNCQISKRTHLMNRRFRKMFIGMKLRSSQCQPSDSYSGSHGIAQRNTSFLKRLPFLCKLLHAFSFISNTLISNARLKFANFQNLSRKILRTELWNLCQMIALFPNSILNTFLSGRVRPIFWKFEFR